MRGRGFASAKIGSLAPASWLSVIMFHVILILIVLMIVNNNDNNNNTNNTNNTTTTTTQPQSHNHNHNHHDDDDVVVIIIIIFIIMKNPAGIVARLRVNSPACKPQRYSTPFSTKCKHLKTLKMPQPVLDSVQQHVKLRRLVVRFGNKRDNP